eukprot:COSAG02_NODE_390_length_23244_cov_35.504558_10_plen_297_part_00
MAAVRATLSAVQSDRRSYQAHRTRWMVAQRSTGALISGRRVDCIFNLARTLTHAQIDSRCARKLIYSVCTILHNLTVATAATDLSRRCSSESHPPVAPGPEQRTRPTRTASACQTQPHAASAPLAIRNSAPPPSPQSLLRSRQWNMPRASPPSVPSSQPMLLLCQHPCSAGSREVHFRKPVLVFKFLSSCVCLTYQGTMVCRSMISQLTPSSLCMRSAASSIRATWIPQPTRVMSSPVRVTRLRFRTAGQADTRGKQAVSSEQKDFQQQLRCSRSGSSTWQRQRELSTHACPIGNS